MGAERALVRIGWSRASIQSPVWFPHEQYVFWMSLFGKNLHFRRLGEIASFSTFGAAVGGGAEVVAAVAATWRFG